MSQEQPKITNDPLYQLLRDGQIDEFNTRRRQGEACDLIGVDFRNVDLRGLDAKGLDMRDCYMRLADLRGIDFRDAQMEGVSIGNAKISGCYFPKQLTAEELELSLVYGTRMRYKTP